MTDRIDLVLADLRCPVCGHRLMRQPGRLACAHGHSFDTARQGYVNLLAGAHPGTGDDAAMVIARERFLAAGHYQPIVDAVLEQTTGRVNAGGLIVDVAGGTGFYSAAVLAVQPAARGVIVDLSTAALRRAARAHERAAAVGADAWAGLPLRDGCAAVVLSVFGPRNREEITRVLAPDGLLVTVTPSTQHLHQLVAGLGLLGVGADKTERLTQDYGEPVRVQAVEYDVELPNEQVHDVVGMGPTAKHVPAAELRQRLDVLARATTVTVAVRVASFRHPAPPG